MQGIEELEHQVRRLIGDIKTESVVWGGEPPGFNVKLQTEGGTVASVFSREKHVPKGAVTARVYVHVMVNGSTVFIGDVRGVPFATRVIADALGDVHYLEPADPEKRDLLAMVNRFCYQMARRLMLKADEGWSGWRAKGLRETIAEGLESCVRRGDYVDAANYAAILWNQEQNQGDASHGED